jgi:SAM-dependent methyltransferase
MKRHETRRHYRDLVETRRANRGLSCGFTERYDPSHMRARPSLLAELGTVVDACLERHGVPRAGVLDAGCGTFFYRDLLETRFERVVGVDSSRAMLGAATAREGLVAAEIESLPFRNGSFSCVFGLDVLHHLEDPRPFLREAARVLADGGAYVGIEPNMRNPGMLLAHALPREERGALVHNWPRRLASLLAACFEPAAVRYYNLGLSAGLSDLARVLHPFRAGGSSPFALRMTLVARKRP